MENIKSCLRRKLFEDPLPQSHPNSLDTIDKIKDEFSETKPKVVFPIIKSALERSEQQWGIKRYWSGEDLILGTDDGLVGLLNEYRSTGENGRDQAIKAFLETEGIVGIKIEEKATGYSVIARGKEGTTLQLDYSDQEQNYSIKRYGINLKNEAAVRYSKRLEAQQPHDTESAVVDGTITDIGVIVYNLDRLKVSIRHNPKTPRVYKPGTIREFASVESATETIRNLITEEAFKTSRKKGNVYGFYLHYGEPNGGYNGPDAKKVNDKIHRTYNDVVLKGITQLLNRIEERRDEYKLLAG